MIGKVLSGLQISQLVDYKLLQNKYPNRKVDSGRRIPSPLETLKMVRSSTPTIFWPSQSRLVVDWKAPFADF